MDDDQVVSYSGARPIKNGSRKDEHDQGVGVTGFQSSENFAHFNRADPHSSGDYVFPPDEKIVKNQQFRRKA